MTQGSRAVVIDNCSKCKAEIRIEVDTKHLKPGVVWVDRLCEECQQAEYSTWCE